MESPYIKTKDFAELAQRPEATVRYWRHVGYGPPSCKRGRIVLYRRADVEQWLEDGFNEQDGSGGA